MSFLPAPKKQLGQNFLNDQGALNRIVAACQLKYVDVLVEIGPGRGALTKMLLGKTQQLIAVERDKELCAHLNEKMGQVEGFFLINHDFLSWPLPSGGPFKVVGNIPYYISTPIIERLIGDRSRITQVVLTVQKEFGERLAAKPGGKEFGALTCWVQYFCEVELLFGIKRTAFHPVPNVDSCCVKLTMRAKPAVSPKDEEKFFKVIRTAFTMRRKNIINALHQLADKATLTAICEKAGIDLNARPETLNLQNYVDISDALI